MEASEFEFDYQTLISSNTNMNKIDPDSKCYNEHIPFGKKIKRVQTRLEYKRFICGYFLVPWVNQTHVL